MNTSERQTAGEQLAHTLNTWQSGPGPLHATLDGTQLLVRGPGGAQTLRLGTGPDGAPVLTGRGGRLPLGPRTTAAVVAGAVGGEWTPAPEHALAPLLAAHGFAFGQVGPALRFKYECWLTRFHARHPDGRVHWFEAYEHWPYHGELALHTLDSGVHPLGGHAILSDEESLVLHADEFFDALRAGCADRPPPVWAYTWAVQPQTVAALLAGADALPGARPDTFFKDPDAAPGVTRHDLFPAYLRGLERRAAQPQQTSVPGAGHEDLPF